MRRLLLLLVLLTAATARADEPAPADSLIWVSETAAADSLARYWQNLDDADWYDPLTPRDLGLGLTPAAWDSLVQVGDTRLWTMLRGRPWRLGLRPLAGATYNRAEGPVLGLGLVLDRPGPRQPRAEARVTYGFAREAATYGVRATLPLATARPRDPDGHRIHAPWTSLELGLDAGRRVAHFGGEEGLPSPVVALFGGDDPWHYLERGRLAAELTVRPRRWLAVRSGAARVQDRALPTATRWSLFADEQDVAPNLPAVGLDAWEWSLGLDLEGRREHLRADVVWSRRLAGDTWRRRLNLHVRMTRRDALQNEWLLHAGWRSVEESAPLQWTAWLGGWGTLRAYEAGELVGDRAAHAALTARWNLDVLRLLRVPLLKDWDLQPLTFVEAGWADDRGPVPRVGARGRRADVGFGFTRIIGLGDDGPMRLTAVLAWPVGENPGGTVMQFSVGMDLH